MSADKETPSVSSIPDPQDVQAVTSQIGRAPRGFWHVARRCACGHPMVIRTDPRLEDGTPFPTLYWLTCKALNSRIGQLEASGWMREINDRLRADETLREQLAASTRLLIRTRDDIEKLSRDDHPGGGPQHVKCLHAHVAHHLVSDDNPIGKEALSRIAWAESEGPCV